MTLSKKNEEILVRIQADLDSQPASSTAGLRVVRDTAREEDDWLYVAVKADRPGIRAIDLVEVLEKVERHVRESTKAKVLLVPAAG